MDKQQLSKCIGQYIRDARRQKQITAKQVSDIVGINEHSLFRIERGCHATSFFSIISILKAIDEPLENILEVIRR